MDNKLDNITEKDFTINLDDVYKGDIREISDCWSGIRSELFDSKNQWNEEVVKLKKKLDVLNLNLSKLGKATQS